MDLKEKRLKATENKKYSFTHFILMNELIFLKEIRNEFKKTDMGKTTGR